MGQTGKDPKTDEAEEELKRKSTQVKNFPNFQKLLGAKLSKALRWSLDFSCTIHVSFCLKVRAHFPELRSGRSSLVVIDGEMKSLTSEFIEQVKLKFDKLNE